MTRVLTLASILEVIDSIESIDGIPAIFIDGLPIAIMDEYRPRIFTIISKHTRGRASYGALDREDFYTEAYYEIILERKAIAIAIMHGNIQTVDALWPIISATISNKCQKIAAEKENEARSDKTTIA